MCFSAGWQGSKAQESARKCSELFQKCFVTNEKVPESAMSLGICAASPRDKAIKHEKVQESAMSFVRCAFSQYCRPANHEKVQENAVSDGSSGFLRYGRAAKYEKKHQETTLSQVEVLLRGVAGYQTLLL